MNENEFLNQAGSAAEGAVSKHQWFASAVFLTGLAVIGGFVVRTPALPTGQTAEDGGINTSDDAPIHLLTENSDPFSGIDLKAKAAYVLDAESGAALFEKNGEAQLPLASLTKLMTAAVAAEKAPPFLVVGITGNAVSNDGDSGFKVGERWRLSDLIDFTLISSSNDGASAIAAAVGALNSGGKIGTPEEFFLEEMNRKARKLGLAQTFFLNETGLDFSSATAGGYGSARDVAQLLLYLVKYHPNLLEATGYNSVEFISLDGESRVAKEQPKNCSFY